MLKRQKDNEKIKLIKEEIKSVYLQDNTPWILGYSGGKDSTVVLQLVVEVLTELQQNNLAHKKVYVISSDTLVENPIVISKTLKSMDNLNVYAQKIGIPLKGVMLYPEFDNTFFVNVIGRGYPVPLQSFRWCTDRIKIKPANKFILEKVDENGEVILLLGTRFEESISRARSMEKYEIENSILSLHSTIDNAWTYPVIRHLTVTDVWNYLLKNPSPWGDDNKELYELYSSSSSDGECPLVIDKETKESSGSCGNSRFGCWTCTVVAKDKSLTGFIESGSKWLAPFLKYRDELIKNRDILEKRNLFDKNGNLKLVEVFVKKGKIVIPQKLDRDEIEIELNDTEKVMTQEKAYEVIKKSTRDIDNIIIKKHNKYYRIGRSGYTFSHRYKMLEDLLDVGQKIKEEIPTYEIIKKEEIVAIDKLWKNEGYFEKSVIGLYNKYISKDQKKLNVATTNIDYNLLKKLSLKHEFDEETLFKLLNNTKKNKELNNRNANIVYIGKKLSEHKLILKGKH